MNVSDKIIFNEIRKGNREVYEALFAEYYDSLVRFGQSFLFDQQEAEDLVQDLFVHIWEHASSITITASVKAYFYQSIRNKCINHIRSLKVKDKNNSLYVDGILQSGDDIELFDVQLIETIKKSIDELPEQMARIFKMKLIENKKRDEIADELNISINTVKTQLQRAKTKLREKLLDQTKLYFFL